MIRLIAASVKLRPLGSLLLALATLAAMASPPAGRLIPADALPLPPEHTAPPIDQRSPDEVATRPVSAGAVASAAPSGPVIALLDFESNTLTPDQISAFSAALWSRMAVRGGLRMLPREETRAWLIRNDLHPSMPYQAAPVPLPKVAAALRADQVVTGRIDRVEAAWNIELAVQGLSENKPRQLAQVKVGDLNDVMLLMDSAARQASAGALGEELKPLTILGRESAAKTNVPVKMAQTTKIRARKVAGVIEQTHKPRRSERQLAAAEPKSVTASAPAERAAAAEAQRAAPEPAPDMTRAEETAHQPAPQAAKPQKAEPVPSPTPNAPSRKQEPEAEPAKESISEQAVEAAASADHPAETAPAHSAPAAAPAAATTPADTPAVSARNLFQQALALETTNPERLSKMEQAAKLAPGDAEIQLRLANEYYGREQFEPAIAACDRALLARPGDSMLHTIKGSALFELRRFNEARAAHAAALQADPKNNWARYNLALALAQTDQAAAIPAWKDYLAKAVNDPAHRALLERAREQLSAAEKAAGTGTAERTTASVQQH